MGIVKILFEEVENNGLIIPSDVAIRLNGRIFLLSLDFTAAQAHETQIWMYLSSYQYLWELNRSTDLGSQAT